MSGCYWKTKEGHSGHPAAVCTCVCVHTLMVGVAVWREAILDLVILFVVLGKINKS